MSSAETALTIEESVWGRLSIDRVALLDALATATHAVGEAHRAATWKNDEGFPVNSAWSDMLFGINSTLDGLIDLLEESTTPPAESNAAGSTPPAAG